MSYSQSLKVPEKTKYSNKTIMPGNKEQDKEFENSSLSNGISVIEKNISKMREMRVNDGDIIKRLLKLANDHINVQFKSIANKIYMEKYYEYLPAELLNTITFDVTLNTTISNSLKRVNNYIQDVNIDMHELIPFDLKSVSEEFYMEIYKCRNVTEIWGTIVDDNHSGKVKEMSDQMELYYGSKNSVKIPLKNGCLYAMLDGDKCWHRVKCVKHDNYSATVLFIDRGNVGSCPVENLYMLDRKFCSCPAQSIRLCLSDLDIFLKIQTTKFNINVILFDLLFKKTVLVKVCNLDQNNNDCLLVNLYFMKGGTYCHINNLIMNEMFTTVLNPLSYIESNKMIPVQSISHVSERGIFIQLKTESFKYFEILMKKTIDKYFCNENFKQQTVVRFDGNKIYFVKCSDKKWYRAKILKFVSEKEIQVLLIDTGSVVNIKRDDFILLNKFCNILAQYPAQAIEIQLEGLSDIPNAEQLYYFRYMALPDHELYATFVTISELYSHIPIVQLYKKTVNNMLISMNSILLADENNITPDAIILHQQLGKYQLLNNNDFPQL